MNTKKNAAATKSASKAPAGKKGGGPVASLDSFYCLGRSGLRVSPLCLGTMTFGPVAQTRCDDAESRRIFDRYRAAGGNFYDTADKYCDGESEKLLGKFIKQAGIRDEAVIATKFTFSSNYQDPNGGGNGRKHILDAVDASLRRLQTDRIDLYWMHVWDTMTPVEEVMATLDQGIVLLSPLQRAPLLPPASAGGSDSPATNLSALQRGFSIRL
jgi:predicted aldo/keto reductase-like oxidoreductase